MSWLSRALGSGWRVFVAYRWIYAIPIATLLLPAVLLTVRMPDTFESRAVVRAREQSGGGGIGALPSEESQRAFATVSTSRERLLTAGNLAAIVPLLVPGADADDGKARERVLEKIEFDRQSDYAFTVKVTDTDPARASEAVNTLLRAFLESERTPLLRRARDRRVFYEREAEQAKQAYQEARKALEAVRAANAANLPEAKDALGTEIAGLRAEIALHEQSAAAARRRMEFLSDQLTRAGRAGAVPAEAHVATAQEKQLEHQLSEQQKQLDASRKTLAEARTRYTDKMPIVAALRKEVAGLQESVSATVRELNAARRRSTADERARKERDEQESAGELTSLREQAAAEAAEATAKASRLRGRVRELETRLASIPGAVAALAPASRAVEEAEKRMTSLQAEADRAAERETFFERGHAEDVTNFAVAEWAKPAATPTGPRRVAWLLTAIGLGALVGYLLTILKRSFADARVTTAASVAQLLPGALIVGVPRLPDGRRRRVPWRDLGPLAWTTACLALAVLAIAAHKGWIDGPGWLETLIGRSA